MAMLSEGLVTLHSTTTTPLLKSASCPHLNLPIVHLLLPVWLRPLTRLGWHSSMFPTNSRTHPSQLPPSSLRFCASPASVVRFYSVFAVWSSAANVIDVKRQVPLPSPWLNAHRVAVKPLVIVKHNVSPSTSTFNNSECPISTSLLQLFKISIARPIPLCPLSSSEESCYETDAGNGESGSERYTRKSSPSPLPSSPHKPSRPYPRINVRPSPLKPATRNHSHSHLSHSPLPSLLLANDKAEEASY
jgi:hypothetical protein